MAKKDKKEDKRGGGLSLAEQLAMKTGSSIPVETTNHKKNMQNINIDSKEYHPEVIGSPFFNPYTFIPFPDKKEAAKRHNASLLTVDEREKLVNQSSTSINQTDGQQESVKRRTGILEIDVKTISPLLTQEPMPYKPVPYKNNSEPDHKFFKALTIGNDVIVPSTSIRGSLRTLMTILSGGTLGYIDTELFLYQRRDTQLGPVKTGDGPKKVFLAEVITPGDSQRSGTIRLGETCLLPTKKLKELFNRFGRPHNDIEKARPSTGKNSYWINDPVNPTILSKEKNLTMKWKLKLSGRKINNEPEFKVKKNDKVVQVERSHIQKLIKSCNVSLRNDTGKVWIDAPHSPQSASSSRSETHHFNVFLTKPNLDNKFKNNTDRKNHTDKLEVKGVGVCREGAFKPEETEIELDNHFWADYQGRNKHGEHPELKSGDLVWLEAKDKNASSICSAEDIESLQWARWGRKGKRLDELVPEYVKPDCMRNDRKVDMVTDLFGQIPMENYNLPNGKADTVSFAGRIKPYNLVFNDGVNFLIKEVTLAPLSSPKPGCIAFYRDDLPDNLNNKSDLKGYKVYRNSDERGDNAPWEFKNQGVYEDNGEIKNKYQKVNKTVELLQGGVTGTLKISFRSLSDAELALLLTACTVDWKLGGGKPLGLGHCRVVNCRVISEDGEIVKYGEHLFDFKSKDGENITLPDELKKHITHINNRINDYKQSQKPIELIDPQTKKPVIDLQTQKSIATLRYPRAVEKNNKKNSRGGHVWFSRHANIKHNDKDGLETMEITGKLKEKCKERYKEDKKYIAPQPLPVSYDQPLYGYDCVTEKDGQNNTKKVISKIELFDPKIHVTGEECSGGFHGQNKNSRQAGRDSRSPQKK